jgi:SAM-dependent methyltransferase
VFFVIPKEDRIMANSTDIPWQEADSAAFIEVGKVFTPRRDEIEAALVSLIPATADEAFTAVELGTGAGWLSAAVLRRFEKARVIGLDGSPTMLRQTAQALTPYGDRVELRLFRLEDDGWLDALPLARAFLSGLVIHHLDGAGKQKLFAKLFERLEPGGALLIADLVAPTSEAGQAYMARTWDEETRQQSVALTGDEHAYEQFVATEWNLFDHPDPVDIPSPLPDQLRWLSEIGYVGVDAWWVRAGHAVYGGYKPSS